MKSSIENNEVTLEREAPKSSQVPKTKGLALSGARMLKPINFYCTAPKAQTVALIGDFNGWDPASHPMQRRIDGWWFLQIPLVHGHHQYLFLVDGAPTLDPHATGASRNERYSRVSLIAVS